MPKIGPVTVNRYGYDGGLADTYKFDSLIEAVCYFGYNAIQDMNIRSSIPGGEAPFWNLTCFIFVKEFGEIIPPSVVREVADISASADGTRYRRFKRYRKQHFHWGAGYSRPYRNVHIRRQHKAEALFYADQDDVKDLGINIKHRHHRWHFLPDWCDDHQLRASNKNKNWKQFRKTRWKEV